MNVLDVVSDLTITAQDVETFQRDGYLIVSNPILNQDTISELVSRVHRIFKGEFDTGIYPDEWHWREGISKENVTREICNSWKCDSFLARYILSAALGRACAKLGGWNGARIGQDDVWIKPPAVGCKEIAYHTDAPYISKWFTPEENNMVTAWLALDNVSAETGTLQYVPGSHKWKKQKDMGEFHAPDEDYRFPLEQAKRCNGIEEVGIVQVEIPAGGISFHHQDLWHGSGINRSASRYRRNIAVHMLRSDVQWSEEKTGYIYGRYRRKSEKNVDENFFPIVWTKEGYRTNLEGLQ